jgi:hypothetical protein
MIDQPGNQRTEWIPKEGEKESLDESGDGEEFSAAFPGEEARALESEFGLAVADGDLNGLITNDKFCMVRSRKLKLSHWRKPLRLRQNQNAAYSLAEEMQCGGNDEAPVAEAANSTGARGWPETVGSGVFPASGNCANDPSGASGRASGGEPCE